MTIPNTFHLTQTVGDFQIGLVMRLGCPLDQEKLRQALFSMLEAFPVLGCAFVPGRRRAIGKKKNGLTGSY